MVKGPALPMCVTNLFVRELVLALVLIQVTMHPQGAKTRPSSNTNLLGYVKCMVTMATHSGFENGGMSKKLPLYQLLLI